MAKSSWEVSESPSTPATIWRILTATGIVSMLLTLLLFWRGTISPSWFTKAKTGTEEKFVETSPEETGQLDADPFPPEEEEFLVSGQDHSRQSEPTVQNDSFLTEDDFPVRREERFLPPVSETDQSEDFVTFDPNESEPVPEQDSYRPSEVPAATVSQTARPRPTFGDDDDSSARPGLTEPVSEPDFSDSAEPFVVEAEPAADIDDEPFSARPRSRPTFFDEDDNARGPVPARPSAEAEPFEPEVAVEPEFMPELDEDEPPFRRMGHNTEELPARPSMDDDEDPFGGAAPPERTPMSVPAIQETGPFEVAPEMPVARPRPNLSDEDDLGTSEEEPVRALPSRPMPTRPSFDDEPFGGTTQSPTNVIREEVPMIEEEPFEEFEEPTTSPEPVMPPAVPVPRPRPNMFDDEDPAPVSPPMSTPRPLPPARPTFDDDSPFEVEEPPLRQPPMVPSKPVVPVESFPEPPARPRPSFPTESAPPRQLPARPPLPPQGAPKLQVEMTGPERVVVGESVVWEFRITNRGNLPATGLVVRDELPSEVRHPQSSDLEYRIGTLAPGDSRSTRLRLTAVAPGTIINRAVAFADGGVQAIATTSLQIEPAVRPDDIDANLPANNGTNLDVSRSGPKYWFVGQAGVFANRIENPGNRPVESIEVVEQIPEGVMLVAASAGGRYDPETRTVHWSFSQLAPSDVRHVQVTLVPRTPGPKASRVFARDRFGSEGATTWDTEVHCPVPAVLSGP